MDKLVDHSFILLGNGQIKDFNGKYSEFNSSLFKSKESKADESSAQKQEIKDPAVDTVRKLSYKEKMEMETIEKELKKMEARKKEIEELFQDPQLSGEKIQELSIELGDIDKTIESHEERWLELSEFM